MRVIRAEEMGMCFGVKDALHAARLRQRALLELVRQVHAVVVVGGRRSNNTRRLLQLCHDQRMPAIQVESADELDPAWFEDARTGGLTADTSTLDETIDEVQRALEQIEAGQSHGARPAQT
jgi:4-hydroxy-3-methylbut-2-enyl diphosphate reductase